jgi:hypothetical protein
LRVSPTGVRGILVRHDLDVTREAAKRDLFACIEGYYNREDSTLPSATSSPEQAELQAA